MLCQSIFIAGSSVLKRSKRLTGKYKKQHQPNGVFFKILFKIGFAEINPFIITKRFASQQLAIWCPAFQILGVNVMYLYIHKHVFAQTIRNIVI